MSEEPAFIAGTALGQAIWACFEAIAKIDEIPVHEAVEDWISTYITNRITDSLPEP